MMQDLRQTGTVAPPRAVDEEDARPPEVLERLAAMQGEVMSHPVYGAVDAASLPYFMEHHVFAVLDFMWLLKSLQVSLTNTDIHWTPEGDPTARRFVNEIVLGEESDSVDGRHVSHFDLYLDAMREAGADVTPVLDCVDSIRAGMPVTVALGSCEAPLAAVDFSLATWRVASDGDLHERVAAFAFGREEIIPDMFTRLLDEGNRQYADRSFPTFQRYLERHVEVDGDVHGPLSLALVRNVCGGDSGRWRSAEVAATEALRNRAELWDAVLEGISQPAGCG